MHSQTCTKAEQLLINYALLALTSLPLQNKVAYSIDSGLMK